MIEGQIAHYQITAKLGQGGMGEVYRALDTKLDREVAIKVLPESVSKDEERLTRFAREAKTLAKLNHPNIASIYGLEQQGESQALVLELIEGVDLSERLKQGALPLDETLEICRQIAEALEAAHDKGIIHRDLKPGNIRILDEGQVKVLDFGLAKALTEESDSSLTISGLDSPTITDAFTKPGVILGTAGYMSPEQARGKKVDQQTDVWAFGCVLHECLTGKRAFQGEDITDTLATIIKGDVDWKLIPASTPVSLILLLRKCLAKDRRSRLQNIADARLDLLQALEADVLLATEREVSPEVKRGIPISVFMISLGLVFLATWFGISLLDPEPTQEPTISEVGQDTSKQPPAKLHRVSHFLSRESGRLVSLALSPDDRQLVYQLSGGGPLRRYWLESGLDEAIAGTDGGNSPFFSSDGKSFGFWGRDKSPRQLWIIKEEGDAPKLVLEEGGVKGASWNNDNLIVYAKAGRGLYIVDIETGDSQQITEVSSEEDSHCWPQWLPDGKHILFMRAMKEDDPNSWDAVALNTETNERVIVERDCTYARYAQPGNLFYVVQGDLYVKRIDLATLSVEGEQQRIRSSVQTTADRQAFFDISHQGTLVVGPGKDETAEVTAKLKWLSLDPPHQFEDASSVTGKFTDMDLSPDDRQVALVEDDRIYTLDLETGNKRPLISHFNSISYSNRHPVYQPVGGGIVYQHTSKEDKKLVWIRRNLFSEPQAIQPESSSFSEAQGGAMARNYNFWPEYISADGKTLYGVKFNIEGRWPTIFRMSLDDSPEAEWNEMETLVSGGLGGNLSPDQNWIIYSGGPNDVTLKKINSSSEAILVTNVEVGNVACPKWAKDGKSILFRNGQGIWRVEIQLENEEPRIGAPVKVIDLPPHMIEVSDPETKLMANRSWEIDSAEKRLLVLVDESRDLGDRFPSSPVTTVDFIFNLFADPDLKQVESSK